MDPMLAAAYGDPDDVWAWLSDHKANTRTISRLDARSLRFDFTWTKFKRDLGKPCIELIWHHELIDESEEFWCSLGPDLFTKFGIGAISCHYLLHKDGRGEGW